MMDCREARDLLLEARTGTTSPDVRRRLAEHLAACAGCRAEAAALEEVTAPLRAVPEPRLPEGYWAAFMAALDRRLAADRQRLWVRLGRWLRNPIHAWSAAVATAALVVVLGFTLFTPPAQQARIPTAEQPAAVEEFMTEAMVKSMPAMNVSLTVWKAGLGASEVPYDLTGDR